METLRQQIYNIVYQEYKGSARDCIAVSNKIATMIECRGLDPVCVQLLKRWYANGDVEDDKDTTIFSDTISFLDRMR